MFTYIIYLKSNHNIQCSYISPHILLSSYFAPSGKDMQAEVENFQQLERQNRFLECVQKYFFVKFSAAIMDE